MPSRSPPQSAPLRPWLWLMVGAVLLLGSFPYFERLMNANERPRLLQGMALIEDGDWAIDGPIARGWKPGPDVARGVGAQADASFPNKPPGTSVVAAAALVTHLATAGEQPSMRGYVWWARLFGGLIPTLGLLVFAWRRDRRVDEPALVLASWVLYVLATPVFSYARLLFGHQLAAVLLFVGVATIVDLDETNPSPWRAALGGAAAGAAVAVEYTAAFAGIPIAIFLLHRAWRGRAGGAWKGPVGAGVGAVIPVIGLAAYQAHAFGSAWTTSYHHVTDAGFAEVHGRGLLGLGVPTGDTMFEHVLSPWGGLLVWCPLLVVGIVGLFDATRDDDGSAQAWLFLAIVLTFVAVNLGLTQAGGWRVGPRYLVVALPFAIAGVRRVLRQGRGRPTVFATVAGVGLYSTLVNGVAATFFPHLIPVGNPWRDQLLPLWLDGRAPYGLAWSVGLGAVGPTLVILGALAATAVALAKVGASGLRAWLGALVLAGLLVGALAAVPSDPAADDTRKALAGLWEPRPERVDAPRPLHPAEPGAADSSHAPR